MQNKVANQTAGSRDYLPALDGLRFMAAMLVAGGHYASIIGQGTFPETLASFTGLGMTLFFVLSGFVIHYNYYNTIPKAGGTRSFAVARFARLYPLYFILFVFDFTYTDVTARSACGHAGEGHWLGLISYLTLTQSWFYAVICKASMIYQYGPVSAVSWSISVEVFFYVTYVGIAKLIARKKWSLKHVLIFSSVGYLLVVVFLFSCSGFQLAIDRAGFAAFGPVATVEAGYNDSLLRWLLYFNPVARLGEFFAGMAAAHFYVMQRPDRASRHAQASAVVFVSVVAVVATHLWLYDVIAPNNVTVARIASPLYGPLIAIMMYLVARYDTRCSRMFSNSILVRFGEASYSIYLLHEILPSAYKRIGLLAPDQWFAWPLWTGSLILLALISRLSYLYIERPARFAIRKWLGTGR
jgi:peptidoglycan/LPS O-acetylase OafA/YrhL